MTNYRYLAHSLNYHCWVSHTPHLKAVCFAVMLTAMRFSEWVSIRSMSVVTVPMSSMYTGTALPHGRVLEEVSDGLSEGGSYVIVDLELCTDQCRATSAWLLRFYRSLETYRLQEGRKIWFGQCLRCEVPALWRTLQTS